MDAKDVWSCFDKCGLEVPGTFSDLVPFPIYADRLVGQRCALHRLVHAQYLVTRLHAIGWLLQDRARDELGECGPSRSLRNP